MPDNNKNITSTNLNKILIKLFKKAVKEINSINLRTPSIADFDNIYEITSDDNKNIQLQIPVREFPRHYPLLELTQSSLKIKNINILIDSSLIISEIYKFGIDRIEKITFTEVFFSSKSKDRDSHCKIALHKIDSAEFNYCQSDIEMRLTCNSQKLMEEANLNKENPYKTAFEKIPDIIIDRNYEMTRSEVNIEGGTFKKLHILYKKLYENTICEVKVKNGTFDELLIHVEPINENKLEERAASQTKLLNLISDNTIESLKFSLPKLDGHEYETRIVNKNTIKLLKVDNYYPNIVAWGLHESIGAGLEKVENDEERTEARKNIDNNKAVLMRFKKMANDKGDRVQEATINSHIAKCDQQLISLEPFGSFWQDKLIMLIGWLFSNHGTSWILPLLWIFGTNLFIGVCIFSIISGTWSAGYIVFQEFISAMTYGFSLELINLQDYLYLVGELFYPFSTPLGIIKEVDNLSNYSDWGFGYIGIVALVAISKAVYTICIYEFVRAARRFTIR